MVMNKSASYLSVCASLGIKTLGRDGIDLINEDDAGLNLLG